MQSNAINSTNNTAISQEYPKLLVDKELFESLEALSETKTINRRKSKASMRKAKADVQNQPNLKEVLNPKKEVNQDLVDILVKYGNNPLHNAVMKEDLYAIDLLINYVVEINNCSPIKNPLDSALNGAIEIKNLEIAQKLINNGATVTPSGWTSCLNNNWLEGIQFLIENKLVCTYINDRDGLYRAMHNCSDSKIIKLLIRNGANCQFNCCNRRYIAKNLLTIAIQKYDDLELFKLLINNGARVDINDTVIEASETNALYCAVSRNQTETVKLLIDSGAKVFTYNIRYFSKRVKNKKELIDSPYASLNRVFIFCNSRNVFLFATTSNLYFSAK